MSISYEEALATLQAMFGEPWNRENLDEVLRHHQGHMENTVESVLSHGDGEPQALIRKLKSPLSASALDEQLAQQLAREQSSSAPAEASAAAAAAAAKAESPSPPAVKKGRGTPTSLPPDFLRIPGRKSVAGNSDEVDQDEALARMLQDELFSQELANNPEFAHLARPRTGRPTNAPANRRGRVGELPSRSLSASGMRSAQGEEGPNLQQKIAEMGDAAKRRLLQFAAQINATNRFGLNQAKPAETATPSAGSGGMGGSSGAASERRGLLDDGEDGTEDEGMEMAFGSKKTM